MKTTLGKVKLAFLLSLVAAIICCVSIAFAGIFGAKNSVASADEATEEEVTENVSVDKEEDPQDDYELQAPSDNDADGLNTSDNATITIAGRTYTYDDTQTLSGSVCSDQYNYWCNALNKSRNGRYVVYVKMTQDWNANTYSYNYMSNSFRGVSNSSAFAGGMANSTSSQGTSFGRIYVGGSCKIILDLNGHSINRGLTTSSRYGSVIFVASGSLTIVDSTGGGTITGGYRSPGYGGGIYVQTGTLNFDGGTVAGNKAEYGGGIYVQGSGSFNMRGGVVSDNTAYEDNGGGVYVYGKFTMSGGIIKNNYSAQEGGGVYCQSFEITGGEITNNSTYLNTYHTGGGIYAEGTATSTLSNGIISKNRAGAGGGGVYCQNSNFTMYSGTITGNSTHFYNGGGVYCRGQFTMYNGYITGNSASHMGPRGGGVYCRNFTINNGTISGNAADSSGSGDGGGIYAYGGSYTNYFYNGDISNNEGYEYGGGIYSCGILYLNGGSISGNHGSDGKSMGAGVYALAALYIQGTTIANNTSNKEGAGVYASGNVTMTNGSVTKNSNNSYAGSDGAGIYCCGNFTMSGGSITNNIAGDDGGGVYLPSGNCTISAGTISNNTAGGAGGGVYMDNTGTTFRITGGSITNNIAGSYGGGLKTVGLTTIEGGDISGNRSGSEGGGIYSSRKLTISGGSVANNTATHGGGGIVVKNRIEISGKASITGNTSSQADGGGVHASSATMSGGDVSNNAAVNGGGIYAGSLVMTNGTVSRNVASSNGGGVNSYSTVNVSGGTISSNTSSNFGGGVYATSDVTISGKADISGNTATNGGGGVYGNAVTISGGTISGNSYSSSSSGVANGGGGVYAKGIAKMSGGVISNNTGARASLHTLTTFEMSGGTITNNRTSQSSWGFGGVVAEGSVTMTGGTISYNVSGGDGGGIYTPQPFKMSNGEIVHNSANRGGGVRCANSMELSGGTISHNTASGEGGGVFVNSGGITMTGGVVSYNNSGSHGGGMRAYSNSNFNGGTVANNSSNNCAGGIFVSSGVLYFRGCVVSGNSAKSGGGGIYANNSIYIYNNNGKIVNNTAVSWGGGVAAYGSSSNVVMSGGAVSGNSVTGDNGYGGGVASHTGSVTVSGGSVTNNSTLGKGGGVYAGANVSLSGAPTIASNTADGQGGGVYGGGTVTMEGGSVTGNKSDTHGGGIYGNGAVTISGKSNISGNTAIEGGGGIYGNSTVTVNGGSITLNSTEDTSYDTGYGGGGVYSTGAFKIIGGDISFNLTEGEWGGGVRCDSTVTIEGGTISGNEAKEYGGGVYSKGAFTMSGGSITLNKSTGYDHSKGAGVYGYTTVTISGGTISENSAEEPFDHASQGGGVYSNGAFKLTKGTISNNKACYGGGVYGDTVTIQGGTITGNDALGYNNEGSLNCYGGGVYSIGAFIMSGGSIVNNIASGVNGDGGGVYGNGTVTISGTADISGNTSKRNGGGVYGSAEITVSGSANISGNKTTGGYGGGVYAPNGLFKMTGGTVANNVSTDDYGGGIYAEAGFELSDGLISGNSSQNGDGGGVHAEGVINITGGTFKNNSSTDWGGGLCVHPSSSSSCTISGVTFIGNYSENDGGGMYVSAYGAVTIQNCTFDRNESGYAGGGLYVYGGNNVNITLRENAFTNNYCYENDNGAGAHISSNDNSANTTSTLSLIDNYYAYNEFTGLVCEKFPKVTARGENISNNERNIAFIKCPNVEMYDCVIIESSNEEGLVFNSAAATYKLTMKQCTVRHNHYGGVVVVGTLTNNVILEGGTYEGYDSYAVDTSGELHVSDNIVIRGDINSPIKSYSASILVIDGKLRDRHDDGYFGAACISAPKKGIITRGYSDTNDESPSLFFNWDNGGVWLLNGEVYVGESQPTLTWQYSKDNGASYTAATGASISDAYTGSAWIARAKYASETAYKTVAYYKDGVGTALSATDVKNVGVYLVKVSDSTSEWANTEFTLVITPKSVTVSGVTANNKTYDGTTAATLNVSGATFTGICTGDTLTVSFSSATFADATAGNNKTVTVSGLVLGGASAGNYSLSTTTLSIQANITPYKTSVEWTNTALEFTGSEQGPSASYRQIGATTSTALTVGGDATATDVGTYTATVTAPANYEFTNASCVWKIASNTIAVIWTDTSFIYNGSAQGPKAMYMKGDEEVELQLTGDSSAINVGTYTATVLLLDANSEFTNTTCTWSIFPKQVEITWGDTVTFEYNGSEQAPTATCTDITISVKGAINAGDHTATVVMTDATQTKNYFITNPTKAFEITKKAATITWVGVDGSTSDFSYTYNGSEQNPTAYFTDAKGNKINFTITGGQTDASETVFTATASTAEYVINYDFTGAGTQTFTISALPVSVVWENTSFEYDGEEHNPTAYYIDITGAHMELALEPEFMGRKNVGEYTAKVKAPTNPNYQITEDSMTAKFFIVKAAPKLTPVIGSTTGLKVGMNMPTIATTEGDTLGTISWVSTELIQGTGDYVWVFVPAQANCYNVVTGSVQMEVGPADGVVLKEITASATITGEIYANTTIADLGTKLVILVTGKYSDGSTGTIASSEYAITAFDSTTGEVTVTMNSDATMKATFTVYVTPKAVTGITVTYAPDGNKIYTNTLLENIATVEVKVNYNDGTSKVVTDYTLSGTLKVGTSTILVSYTVDEKTFKETFDVTVSSDEVALDGISATFVQDKALTLSTELKDIENFGTLTVEKVNNDGSKEPIALSDCTLTLPEGGLKLGTNLITVAYTDGEGTEFTTTFKVFVEEDVNLKGIAASFAQNSTILTSDEFEKLSDFGTLTVEGVYTDGSKKPITENFTLEIADNKFVEGLNTVTVTYTVGEGEDAVTYTATFTVFAQATAKKVIVIVIDNKTSIFGETLAELTFTVLSGNPEFAEGDIVLTKADGKAVGTYAITGEYKGEEYEVKFVEGVYTITPNPSAKQVTVVINNKTSVYGETLITDYDYTVIGLADGEELTNVTLEKADGTDAGEYAITGKYEGSNEFNVEFVNGVYTITPKNVTVVIDNKATKMGATIADLTYEVIGLADGEELDGTIKLTTNAEATTPNEYAITGTFNGNNYAITWVNGKYTVKAGVTPGTILVILDNKTSEYGEALEELSFSIFDETESVSKEAIESDLTITTEATAGADAGKYKITATYSFSGSYTVEIIEATYTITPKIVKVQIDNKLTFKGAELATLTSNASSEFAADITLTTTATGLTAGEYEITGSYTGSTNYDVQFVNGTYTVKEIAAGLTHVVIVIDNQTSVAGVNLNTLTYTTIGLENGETISGIELTTTADKDEVGAYAITGKYTGTGNYVVVFVEGTYTVTAKAVPEVKLTAKQTDEIFLNTTDFDGKLEFTLNVNGTESTLKADDYTLTADLENGTVTVEFTVDGETYIETVTVFVTAKAVTGISVEYNQGTDKITPNTDPNDIQIKVTASYNDGTTAELESGYNIVGKLAEGNNCPLVVTYVDGGVTHSATFTVKVDPLEAGETTKSTIQWKNLEFVFDGTAHVPYAYYTINGGAQEVALKLILVGDNLTNGEAINAGTYTARIDETTEIVAGYELQGDNFHEFVIKQADIVINWTNSTASFDGEAHTPNYKVTSTVDDGKVGMKFEIVPKSGSSLSADGTAVNAGKYVAKVVLMDSENYTVKGDLEKEFSIGKANVSKKPSSTIIDSEKFETLSEAIEYVKGKYGDKVTVTGEQNADGDYVITVSITDLINYEWTEGGNEAQSFKFGSSAIVPEIPEVEGINPILIIALIVAMVLVAFVAFLVFIILRQKNANKAVDGDEDGFYEAYTA